MLETQHPLDEKNTGTRGERKKVVPISCDRKLECIWPDKGREKKKKPPLKCLSLVAWLLLNMYQDTASSSSQEKHHESYTIAHALEFGFVCLGFFKFLHKKFYSIKEK